MEKDMLELLDEIARITLEIKAKYERLPYLLINKDYLFDFKEKMDSLIADLIILRMEEDSAYSLMENNIGLIAKAINYINEREKDVVDDTAKLCVDRIKNNLHLLMFLAPIEDLEDIKEVFEKDRKFKFLLDNGLSPDDAIKFTRKFTFAFEISVFFHFLMTIDEQLPKEKDEDKAALLGMKLTFAFTKGNELEEELFDSSFGHVSNNLTKSVSNSFGIDPKLKDDYQNILALTIIHSKLCILAKTVPSFQATETILEFKTYILYVNKKNLEVLKNNILNMGFSSGIIQSMLVQAIDLAEERKKLHNGNGKQKTI